MTLDKTSDLLNLNYDPRNQAAARVLEALGKPLSERLLPLLQLAEEFYPRSEEGDAGEENPELSGLLAALVLPPAVAWQKLASFPLDQVESVESPEEAAELAQAVAAEFLPAEVLTSD